MLAEDDRVDPPPDYAWTVPIIMDMFAGQRQGLSEVVVTGPGHALLFYGRRALGEGLTQNNTWDAIFLMSGKTT